MIGCVDGIIDHTYIGRFVSIYMGEFFFGTLGDSNSRSTIVYIQNQIKHPLKKHSDNPAAYHSSVSAKQFDKRLLKLIHSLVAPYMMEEKKIGMSDEVYISSSHSA
jgi:hypothetical protein